MIDTYLVDTHTHLTSPRFDDDRESVAERIASNDLEILDLGLDVKTSLQSIDLAQRWEYVHAAAGIHPHNADQFEDRTLDQLSAFIDNKGAIAIGEIGLDYYRDNSPREDQRRVFREQLQLARQKNVPVIIHNRRSTEDLLNILNELEQPPPGVLHSFMGDLGFARRLLDLGLFLGIGGPLTFQNNEDLRQVVKRLPLDRLIIETDSPYLTPRPHRGERNEPIYVRSVAATLAKLHEVEDSAIAELTTSNAYRLFELQG